MGDTIVLLNLFKLADDSNGWNPYRTAENGINVRRVYSSEIGSILSSLVSDCRALSVMLSCSNLPRETKI